MTVDTVHKDNHHSAGEQYAYKKDLEEPLTLTETIQNCTTISLL